MNLLKSETPTTKSPHEIMESLNWTYKLSLERAKSNPTAVNCNAEFYLRKRRDALATTIRKAFRVV